MKAFAASATAGVTLGGVSWNVTYDAPDDSVDLFIELYDSNGNVQYSAKVPCKPPFGCPVAMENVALGSYTAGLAVGDERYYFNTDVNIITTPNDSAHATIIVIAPDALDQEIVIHVQP